MARVSKKQNTWAARSWLVLLLMLGGLVYLFGHVVWLQATEADMYRAEGAARYLRSVELPAKRGMILDRRGEPLAVSTPVESVWANPPVLAAVPDRIPELAEALGLSTDTIARKLHAAQGREFVYLKRHLPPSVAAQIRMLDVPGVDFQREYRRFYPLGALTAQTVGLTNIDDKGLEGMEVAYQNHLSGTNGREQVLRDRRRRDIEVVESVSRVRDGDDLTLTLDTRIQYLTVDALTDAIHSHQAKSGVAVVVDVKTGEVLAMANYPTFNPNNRKGVEPGAVRNRAITDLFEPGSTLKPFAIAAALQAGAVSPGTVVDTGPGRVSIGKHTIKDIRNYGELTTHEIVVKSSNVGTIRIVDQIDPALQVGTLQQLGFGTPTGVGFPGESGGMFDVGKRWGRIQRASLSIGYGISVTALQLAQGYAVLANGGVRVPLTLVQRYRSVQRQRVLDEHVVAQINHMLADVAGDEGTAKLARTRLYTVAGKTGTVRVAGSKGYEDGKYHSVFAGFAPVSEPRLAMVVVINEPGGKDYYGGLVAAPVFSDVMSSALPLLNVRPDIAVQPQSNSVIAQIEERTR